MTSSFKINQNVQQTTTAPLCQERIHVVQMENASVEPEMNAIIH